jgi:hypothetical protein
MRVKTMESLICKIHFHSSFKKKSLKYGGKL